MLPWRRHRRRVTRLGPGEQADAWQLCSLLLTYPDVELVQRLPMLREVARSLPERVADPLFTFLDHVSVEVAEQGLGKLQVDYVDTFDVTRKCALHLTYFLHGDTRNRGVALVRFKQTFRQHGAEILDQDAELPDYLPLVLEFGACIAPDAGWKLLNDHRVGIELVHRALYRRESPWTDVLRAVRATLPTLDDDDELALARLIAQGPPEEMVGIGDDLNSPYAIDPALEELRAPPASGCGSGDSGADPRHTSLGTTISVGAPR